MHARWELYGVIIITLEDTGLDFWVTPGQDINAPVIYIYVTYTSHHSNLATYA